jgi:hypothetical protein
MKESRQAICLPIIDVADCDNEHSTGYSSVVIGEKGPIRISRTGPH